MTALTKIFIAAVVQPVAAVASGWSLTFSVFTLL
jgi:hypothetical protein